MGGILPPDMARVYLSPAAVPNRTRTAGGWEGEGVEGIYCPRLWLSAEPIIHYAQSGSRKISIRTYYNILNIYQNMGQIVLP